MSDYMKDEEMPPVGHPMQLLGAKLADMLDDLEWNNIEPLLIDAWRGMRGEKICGNDSCNAINSGIDECIKPLVKALNDAGLTTVASCCGHGWKPTSVALSDGTVLMVMPNLWTAKAVGNLFPDIHGCPEKASLSAGKQIIGIDYSDEDGCIHGIGFDEVCVICCPEDDDGMI